MRTDRGLLWRAVLPVAAVVALLVDVPREVAGGLALLGLALALEALVRRRGLGLVDGGAVWAGGLLVAVVLTGSVLGSTGPGLTPASWTVALAGLALAAVVVAAVLPPRSTTAPVVELRAAGSDDGRRQLTALLPWVVLAIGAVVLAVRLSAGSVDEVDPLAMSVGRVDGTQVEIVLTSGEATGPLEIRTSVGDNLVSYPLVAVDDDGGQSTATVSLPTTGRSEITLSRPGETEALRTLVLDR